MKLIHIFFTIILILGVANAKKDEEKQLQRLTQEIEINKSIVEKKSKLADIDEKLSKNIWLKRYNDYQSHKKLLEEQDSIKSKLFQLKKSESAESEIVENQKKLEAVKKQIAIYGDSKASLFGELTKVDEIVSPKRIDNPLLVISAISTIRGLADKKSQLESRLEEIDKLIEMLKTKKSLLQDIDTNITKVKGAESAEDTAARNGDMASIIKELILIKNERDDFETTITIFAQKSSEITQRLKFETKEQLLKLLNIAIIVLGLFVLSFLIKLTVKRYLKDNHEKSYVTNKFIAITTYVLITLTLLL